VRQKQTSERPFGWWCFTLGELAVGEVEEVHQEIPLVEEEEALE